MSMDTAGIAEPIVLHMGPTLSRLSDDEFYEFCQLNRDLRIERTSDGDLIIMPPTGGKTGRRNVSVTTQLEVWSESNGLGVVFDSSTGFRLPNGAKRSPDSSWVLMSRWDGLSETEQERFPPLAPDFVVELRSKADVLDELKTKMDEYIENGVRLGWLIDPSTRKVWIYRPDVPTQELDSPDTLTGDPVLPGFVLKLDAIWR
jgi:Uma2 family endonuclease